MHKSEPRLVVFLKARFHQVPSLWANASLIYTALRIYSRDPLP
jgi:hypothetical protein